MQQDLLIVTTDTDVTATLVVEELKHRGISYVRFDTNYFPRDIKLTLKLDQDGSFQGKFFFHGRELNFSDICLVWYRRIGDPCVETSLNSNPPVREWVSEESEWGLYTAMTVLSAPVVNPFSPHNRLQRNKWVQMRVASKLGFEVPFSCQTNKLDDIKTFWHEHKEEVIFKKIRRGIATMMDGTRVLLHTSKIPPGSITDDSLPRMRFCPVFLQQHIPKKYDVRCVIVGERVFAFAIHSQEVEIAKVDYRTSFLYGNQKRIRHEAITLGDDTEKKLVAFVQAFGNHFGVIDLIQTPDERLVFLEDNPEGQWGWLQQETNVPVASAVTDHLLSLL